MQIMHGWIFDTQGKIPSTYINKECGTFEKLYSKLKKKPNNINDWKYVQKSREHEN